MIQKRYNYKSTFFWLAIAIIVLLIAWFIRDDGTPLKEQSGVKVVRVADGDTLEVLIPGNTDKQRVRMLAIDAPELKMNGGQESKRALANLITDCKKEISIKEAYKDQYKRIVGKVLCGDKDLNLEQIKQGNAWVYTSHIKGAFPGDDTKYKNAQKYAKEHKLGLWKEKNPQAPWQWRKENPR